MKCDYCGTTTLKLEGNSLICSSCGAPLKNVYAFQAAPIYVLKIDMRKLSAEKMEILREQWKNVFSGITETPPKLMILDTEVDIKPLQ